jgi:hypothetical protein
MDPTDLMGMLTGGSLHAFNNYPQTIQKAMNQVGGSPANFTAGGLQGSPAGGGAGGGGMGGGGQPLASGFSGAGYHGMNASGWNGGGGMGGMGAGPSSFNPYAFNDPGFNRGYAQQQNQQMRQNNINNQMSQYWGGQKQGQDLGFQQQKYNTIVSPLVQQVMGAFGGGMNGGAAGSPGFNTNFGMSVQPNAGQQVPTTPTGPAGSVSSNYLLH